MAVIALASSPSPLWYLARGSGAVSLVLLSATLILGITGVVRLQPRSPRVPRFLVDGLHRNLSLTVLVFLVAHILMSVLDPFAHIRYLDALIPFVSSYRPIWLGLGAIAFDLLLALSVTSLLRRRVGLRAWRAIHWAAYACWPLAVVHGLASGSDARVGWFGVLTAACVASVVAALGFRLRADRSAHPGRALAGGTLVAGCFAGLLLFALQGPLQPGWAARAGTPPKLLASVRRQPTTAGRVARARLTVPLAGAVDGTLHRSVAADGSAHLQITASVRSTPQPAVVTVDLFGQPLSSGGLRVTGSTATLGSPAAPRLYTARHVLVRGTTLVAVLRPASGRQVRLSLTLSIADSGRVTGTAQVGRV